jgi:hypothetical protein
MYKSSKRKVSSFWISPAQAEQFLRSRRSVRQFKDKPVDRDCPTASNSQLVEWVVLNDPKRLQVRSVAGQVANPWFLTITCWLKPGMPDPMT